MRLASTLNPNSVTEENIPVAIFRYNGQQKFLRLAQDYNGMINIVVKAFKIEEGSLSLQTSTLDACRGESIEIDESAYPVMCSVLGDIDVVVEAEDPLLSAEREDNVGERSLPTPRTSTSEMPSSPRSNADTTSHDETNQSRAAGFLPPTAEDYEEREVEQMDEFTSDHENDVFESRPNEAEVQEEPRRSRTVHSKTVNKGEGTPNLQKFKPVVKSSASTTADDHTPTPHVKKEKDATPHRSIKDLSRSSRASRRDANTTATSVDPESRFELSIAGPEPGQTAQFKTRGKHTAGKVLGAACKTFGIDPNRARLCYIVSIPDDDGDTEQCELECEVDETMAQFGGGANPQLFIKLDPLDDENDDLLNFD